MNGVLTALAVTAANGTQPNPLATSLAAIVPVIVGAIIGYVLSTMRDWTKTKAERAAKYQDQVLEATSELLASAMTITRDAKKAGYAGAKVHRVNESPSATLDDAHAASTEFLEAVQDMYETSETARPHELRISILAPSIAPLASAVIKTAQQVDLSQITDEARSNAAKHTEAVEALTDAVREHLKIPSRRRWKR